MTREDFRAFADSIICYRIKDVTGHNYLRLMNYCENIYRECVGFDDCITNSEFLADLICTGIANAFIAGMEEPR